ncbi:NAD(P)-binding protein [Rostrohypoxylon terebratum]|nr:NAD(P)-binding protein [Rostrohypoxylon terebratum]
MCSIPIGTINPKIVANKTIIIKNIPTGLSVPGEHLVIEQRPIDLDAVPTDGVIVEPIENDTVARVLKSDNANFHTGDVLNVFLPFAQYVAVTPGRLANAVKLENPHKLPLDLIPPLQDRPAQARRETIFTSSAAGAVSSFVDQLAKPWDALGRLAPQGIDVYYEDHMEDRGRIVVCGMVEGCNSPLEERYSVRDLSEISAKRLTAASSIVVDEGFGPAYSEPPSEGVHVTRGTENGTGGLIEISQVKDFGKAVLKIKGD